MVLALQNVSLRLGPRWVLVRLSFAVRPGQTVLLTGDNGAGKTTLLRLLATALRPHRGTLSVFGVSDPALWAQARSQLALLTHHHYFYEALSARENLEVVSRLSPRADPKDIEPLLHRVGLKPHAGARVANYSAGMKRRLGLARLLLLKPRLVLLDEPFGQLDPKGVTLMHDVIHELKNGGATQIISTHDIARGEALSDAGLHLEHGIVASTRHLEPA